MSQHSSKPRAARWLIPATYLVLLAAQTPDKARAQAVDPFQPPPLTALEKLGKAIFSDTALSQPDGQACISCHEPRTGFLGPDSRVNAELGVIVGVVQKLSGPRKTMSVNYSAYAPEADVADLTNLPRVARIPNVEGNPGGFEWSDGQFWDNRVPVLHEQTGEPFLNQLEMHNSKIKQVTQAIRKGNAYAPLFTAAFGPAGFKPKDENQTFEQVKLSITAFLESREVGPFNSRYDRYLASIGAPNGLRPPQLLARVNADIDSPVASPWMSKDELRGLNLYVRIGCNTCHNAAIDPALGPDDLGQNGVRLLDVPPQLTIFGVINDGVPRNERNPFYSTPKSVNPAGKKFVDLGVGKFLEDAGCTQNAVIDLILPPDSPLLGGLPPQGRLINLFNPAVINPDNSVGSYQETEFITKQYGRFKIPTLRNVDLRLNEKGLQDDGFVKAFMHNGALKSLEECVRFYNKRDVLRNERTGKEVTFPDFIVVTNGDYTGPWRNGLDPIPRGYRPLFPPPEVPRNVVRRVAGDRGPIGNLGLTQDEERLIVLFMKTLSDTTVSDAKPFSSAKK